ncbi:MAG TPA: NAD-dependent epimerase/dehydratase family protein [Pseudolysinimonas sp.]|jgi:nucleoside-diphosphate-sugar epimerase
MRLLVLGGTAWLGHRIATTALEGGDEVTCLARGSGIPDGAALVQADRDDPGALDAVSGPGHAWDAVIDVARQPGHVRRAVSALEPVAEHYVFVSSCSVYASQAEIGGDESVERLPALDADTMASLEDYGHAKVACEDAVLAAFGPARSTIARAGLIGGPGDPSDRTSYWPRRFAHPSTPDGTVLTPDAPDLPASIIDVRDLAAWLVRCATDRVGGTFNVMGEALPLPEHVDVARLVAGHRGPVVRAAGSALLEQGVNEWSGPRSLPLWLADPDWYGMNSRSIDRALAAGLTLRPLADTLCDTLAWDDDHEHDGPRKAGLTDDEERELLAVLG